MSNSLFETLKAISPNISVSSTSTVSRAVRDTIVDARQKTVEKLNKSIEFVRNNMTSVEGKKADLVFKQELNGTYRVGAKYGNRWVKNLLGDNNMMLARVPHADLVSIMSAIAKHVEAGHCDDQLQNIIQNNNSRKQKKKAA